MKSILISIKNKLFHEEWNIAIRQKESILFSNEWLSKIFFMHRQSLRFWYADPFVVEHKGKVFLFVEQYDRLHGYADIAVGEIVNNKVKKFKIAYHNKRHLSFPYVFLYENEFYMIPESYSSNRLILLKAKKFPYEWQ